MPTPRTSTLPPLDARSKQMKKTMLGFAAATLVVMFWSGFNVVSRLGGRSVLTPFDLAALRFGVSGILLAPFLLRLRFHAPPLKLLILSLVGGLSYSLLVYGGFALAPAAHAGVLVNGGIPFATAIVAWAAMGYRPGRRALLSLAIAGAGIGLIGYQGIRHGAPATGPQWLGDLFFLAAATCFAIFGLLARKWQVRPIETIVAIAIVCMVLYLPVYLLFLPKAIGSAPWSSLLLQGFYQGVIAASVAALCYTYANLTIGPMKASLMLALVPGISAVLAVPVLNEELGILTALGVVLVTVGAVLGTTSRGA